MTKQNKMIGMLAKYDGKCRECGEKINAGSQIYWSSNAGAFHRECWEGEQVEEFFAGRLEEEEIDAYPDTAQSEATAMMYQETYCDDAGYDPRDAEYETYFND
jgi:hypothetical protein